MGESKITPHILMWIENNIISWHSNYLWHQDLGESDDVKQYVPVKDACPYIDFTTQHLLQFHIQKAVQVKTRDLRLMLVRCTRNDS